MFNYRYYILKASQNQWEKIGGKNLQVKNLGEPDVLLYYLDN